MNLYVLESINWWKAWKTVPVFSWVAAARAFRHREYRKALRLYENGLRKKPNHPAAHCAQLDRVYCLVQLGEITEAIDSLCSLIKKRKDGAADTYRILSRLFWMVGEDRRAREVLRKATYEFPLDAELFSMFVYSLVEDNESLTEAEFLRESIEARLQAPNISDRDKRYLKAAQAYYLHRCGSGDEGEKALAAVIAQAKAPVEAMLSWAECLLEKERYQQAREHLSRCVKHVPRDPRATYLLAHLYLTPSKYLQPFWALRLAQQACQQSSYRNTDCLQLLAECYRSVGDDAGAELVECRVIELRSEREIDFERIKEVGHNIEQLRLIS